MSIPAAIQTALLDTELPRGDAAFVPTPDGGQIHCVRAGSGPAVVLAHGYLLDLAIWNALFPVIAEHGRQAIAFDQRGHGRSREGRAGSSAAVAAGDYRTLLMHFDLHDVTLVAHSMGGFLALLCCLSHADVRQRVKRLVLVGANAGAVGQGSLQNRLQVPIVKSGLMRPLWRFPPTGRALVAQLFGREPDPHCIELTRTILLRQAIHRSLPLLEAMLYDDYYDRVGEISIETRVLCGDCDRTCPAWHSQRLGQMLPHASNVWLPGRGHMLSYEAPDAILEAIFGA